MKKLPIATLALFLSIPSAALAAVPPTLAFSARIGDNGRPVTGDHTVTFAVWNCDGSDPLTCVDTTNRLWMETQTLAVNDGVLSAALGADVTNPLPAFTGVPLWIEVTFDGTVFNPRMPIHSAPFAFRTAEADHAATATTATNATNATNAANAAAVPWTGVTGVPANVANPPRAALSATGQITAVGSTCTNYASGAVTITAPTAGRIIVRGTAMIQVNHTVGITDQVFYYVGSTPTDCTWDYGSQPVVMPAAAATGTYYSATHPMAYYNVAAGTYTFYLNGIRTSGAQTFWWGAMSAEFFPN